MKGKQLGILVVLALILGAGWYLVSSHNKKSWSETGGGGGKVIQFPINDVAHVVIKDAKSEVNLVRKGDTWTVKERADYPANVDDVRTLLRKLQDLKTVQTVEVGPTQMPRLELVEPGKGDKAGTEVQFQGADGKALGGILLGKKHFKQSENEESEGGPAGGFATGRYVMPLGGAKVSLVSETLDDADPKPERWLNKEFVKIESPKSIAVKGTDAAHTWTVTRESASGEWKLADAKPDEKLDAGKTGMLSSVFASPSFSDVKAPDAKLEEPITTANIETFDGFKYELKIGKADGENRPVQVKVSADFPKARAPGKDEKPDDKKKLDEEFAKKQKELQEKLAKEKKFEGRIYLVANFAVDALLKDRAAMLPEKPAEKPATPGAGPAIPGVSGIPGVPGLPSGHPPLPGVPPAPAAAPAPGAAPAPKPAATPGAGAAAAPKPAASPAPAPGSATPASKPAVSPAPKPAAGAPSAASKPVSATTPPLPAPPATPAGLPLPKPAATPTPAPVPPAPKAEAGAKPEAAAPAPVKGEAAK